MSTGNDTRRPGASLVQKGPLIESIPEIFLGKNVKLGSNSPFRKLMALARSVGCRLERRKRGYCLVTPTHEHISCVNLDAVDYELEDLAERKEGGEW